MVCSAGVKTDYTIGSGDVGMDDVAFQDCAPQQGHGGTLPTHAIRGYYPEAQDPEVCVLMQDMLRRCEYAKWYHTGRVNADMVRAQWHTVYTISDARVSFCVLAPYLGQTAHVSPDLLRYVGFLAADLLPHSLHSAFQLMAQATASVVSLSYPQLRLVAPQKLSS